MIRGILLSIVVNLCFIIALSLVGRSFEKSLAAATTLKVRQIYFAKQKRPEKPKRKMYKQVQKRRKRRLEPRRRGVDVKSQKRQVSHPTKTQSPIHPLLLTAEIDITEDATAFEADMFLPVAPATEPAEEKIEQKPVKREYLAGEVDKRPVNIHPVQPVYPDGAVEAGIEGSVKLTFLITEKGEVRQVKVICSSGCSELDRAALTSVRRWRFRPAEVVGKPVAVRVSQTIYFKLE